YVIHLPIVYGWALWPGLSTLVGPTLSPSVAVATALGVTAVSVIATFLGRRLVERPRTPPATSRTFPLPSP
ncbi:MAG: acyltransferase, partial [Myxococcota bacterium]